MTIEHKYCHQLPEDSKTHRCCDSCHEDNDEHFIDLCEVERGGVMWIVCCNKANYLDGQPSIR